MKKIIQAVFLLSAIAFSLNANAEDSFFIKEGKRFELCQELKNVLNDPENKDYAVPYIRYAEFNVPKKFKNFYLPEWKDEPIENISKYIKNPEDVWKEMKKNHDDSAKYKMQKTIINFDNYGEKEVMIRLITNNKTEATYHYISDIGEEDSVDLYHNFNPRGNTFIFSYKGKVFYSGGYSSWVFVVEPEILKTHQTDDIPNKAQFFSEQVCDINLVPEKAKIAKKKSSHDFDIKFLQEVRESYKNEPTEEKAKLIKKIEERLKNYQED